MCLDFWKALFNVDEWKWRRLAVFSTEEKRDYNQRRLPYHHQQLQPLCVILPLAAVSKPGGHLGSWTANTHKKKERDGLKKRERSSISCLFSVNTNESFNVDVVRQAGSPSHERQMYMQFKHSRYMVCKKKKKIFEHSLLPGGFIAI